MPSNIINYADIKENHKKLLEGNLSIEDFWNQLFPFINNILNHYSCKEYREKIGHNNIESIQRLLINLRDKRQRYWEKKEIGDDIEKSKNEKNFISVTKDVIENIDKWINIIPIDDKNIVYNRYDMYNVPKQVHEIDRLTNLNTNKKSVLIITVNAYSDHSLSSLNNNDKNLNQFWQFLKEDKHMKYHLPPEQYIEGENAKLINIQMH